MTDFSFSGMTPALEHYFSELEKFNDQVRSSLEPIELAKIAWLEASPEKDTSHPLWLSLQKCSQEHDAEQDRWRQHLRELKESLPAGLTDQYRKELVVWACRDETTQGDPLFETSPSGRYVLQVTRHAQKGGWDYSKGVVFEGPELRPIQTVCRNHGSFPATFVEDHPNGHDYLVCGYDYQGQTVLELDTGVRKDSLPASAEAGFGFCWDHAEASPSKNTLLVEGCYWAGPFEIWFVDFTYPLASPLPVLHRESDAHLFQAWVGPDAATMERSYEFYIPLGKRADEVTEEEEDAMTLLINKRTPNVAKTMIETFTWTRPSLEQAAKDYVDYLYHGWVRHGVPLAQDFIDNARVLLQNVPNKEERQSLLDSLLVNGVRIL